MKMMVGTGVSIVSLSVYDGTDRQAMVVVHNGTARQAVIVVYDGIDR